MDKHHEHTHSSEHATFDWEGCYSGEASDHEAPDPLLWSLAQALPVGRSLDVGCGAGGLVVALAQRGWQAAGIDFTHNAIKSAREVARAHGVSAHFEVADSTDFHPEQRYDLITSTFALPGSKEERARTFAMMRGCLAPGGHIILTDFDAGMRKFGHFPQYELLTLEELATAFEGLQTLRAEVVDTPVHDHDGKGTHAGERWTAAIFHARRA